MKPTNFKWSYGGDELRGDPTMTRNRMAKMILAWRKSGYMLTRNKNCISGRTGQLTWSASWF